MTEQVQQISLEKIIPNPENRRVGGFDPVKLEQLAASIKDVGVQQPIIVRSQLGNGSYELVAGERRWRAAKLAGLAHIPAIVRELDDLQVLKIQTVENLQREDVHPLDEADGYARLVEKAGYEVDQVAAELGKSASYVYQRLKLRDLVPEARDLFVKGDITAGHAILIARLQPEQQKACISDGLRHWREDDMPSVRHLDSWIHQQILMELSKVTWKLDDAELLPAAGSCTLCPKRTGFQPQLFADVCNGKKDFCTDRVCFTLKAKAMVARRREELKGAPHLEVQQGHVDYRESEGLKKKGILGSYDWQECKAKEKGAWRVLVVAGDAPGRLTWGKKRVGRSYSYKPSPAEKARQDAEDLKDKQETAFRTALYQKIVARAATLLAKNPEALDTGLLRMAVKMFWTRTWEDLQARIVKWESWEQPKGNRGREDVGERMIKKMDEGQLKLMLVKLAIAGDVHVASWSGSKAEDLKAAAKIYGIDLKAVEKEARGELASAQKAKGPRLVNTSKDGKTAKKKGHKDPEYVEMLKEASE